MTKDGVAITWKVVAGHEAITVYQTIALSLSSRPERTQISYLATLATTTYAAFFQGKPHEVYQRR
jgi:hypothetical protein